MNCLLRSIKIDCVDTIDGGEDRLWGDNRFRGGDTIDGVGDTIDGGAGTQSMADGGNNQWRGKSIVETQSMAGPGHNRWRTVETINGVEDRLWGHNRWRGQDTIGGERGHNRWRTEGTIDGSYTSPWFVSSQTRLFTTERIGYFLFLQAMELNKVYFYTATIVEWNHLMTDKEYKNIIINSLQYLSAKKLIKVYAFVIMPNHIHLIWLMLSNNGKELTHASFMKYTSHEFLQKLRNDNPELLKQYRIQSKSRNHQFWQRNALPVELYSTKVFEQKLDYIHNNPLQERWQLADQAEDYYYSSAKFYASEIDDFGFLDHYSELFY